MVPRNITRNFLRKSILLLLVMAIPAFGQEEKKTPPAKPGVPAKPKIPLKIPGKGGTTQPPQKPGTPQTPQRPGTPQTPQTHPGSGRTPPGREVSLRGGGHASLRTNGQIRSVDRNGVHIERNLHGGRTIVTEHNGVRTVTQGRVQYTQRAYFSRGGHDYYSRTYYEHGVYRTTVYRGYIYGGHTYYGYYPAYYYGPRFYVWAYNPWPGPVYWGVGAWGWGGSPWYGYYGFTPYPNYAGPSFWLTDYVVAANLQAAYAAQADEAPAAAPPAEAGSDPVTLTPEVKQAIADEVKAELQAEQAAAAQSTPPPPSNPTNEVPPALDPARRTFVVATDMAVTADGQECSLTEGDVITRIDDTPDQDQKVRASVSSSKKLDCAAGKMVAVSVDDLQEMRNHFEEQLGAGMKELAAKQGNGGMPKSPDANTVASNVPPPPPDTGTAKALQDQQAVADQTESQVRQESAGSGGGGQ
jgi:hypothetical protein